MLAFCQANFGIFDFELSSDDMAKLLALDNGTRYCVPKIKLVSGFLSCKMFALR